MTPSTRLRLVLLMLVLSALYGVLVARDPQTATAISSGYVAAVLTIFGLVSKWRKPEEPQGVHDQAEQGVRPPSRRKEDAWKVYLEARLRRFFVRALGAFAIIGITSAIAILGFGIVLSEQSDQADEIQKQRYDSLIVSCKQQNERHDNAVEEALKLTPPSKVITARVLVDQLQPYVADCAAQARSRVKGDK